MLEIMFKGHLLDKNILLVLHFFVTKNLNQNTKCFYISFEPLYCCLL